ncbi:sugar transferase [Zhihengliuella halotolerans]|uniref:Undecaprenyl-phosphate galactose phosphotransferase WbaP/exopolysaccharide biosynthesis polyprenyl glycosylphosphotransferase n=1 Tax=Zhihengliuella halotolerans TaxID=370736 RepID=A0A4Q8ABB9_9MICC|nr:sugar transferase [Zhihengliuella halotolerans]RZU60819.1 Undecaprenyl-phosphate galactose phosphotransferase WbaP/exopolysaccharide biosynthesis polyprenyl glycosylphosphotransferase [Zhihengliuella halotolerans]
MVSLPHEELGHRLGEPRFELNTGWSRTLKRQLAILDFILIATAIIAAHVLRFGTETDVPVSARSFTDVDYSTLGVAIGAIWWLSLGAWNTRDVRFLGAGFDEYKRVTTASLSVFGMLAIVSYAVQAETARGYVGIALPLGLFLLLVGRWAFRKRIRTARSSGKYNRRVLVIGGLDAVQHLASRLADDPGAGYLPIGGVIPSAELRDAAESGVEIIGTGNSLESILCALESSGADTVAISAGSALSPVVVRKLGWELHARGITMIMAPALTDIAGPRIHTQPVAGLPLIHVATPQLEGIKRVAKRCSDIVFASIGLLLLSPVLLVVAILIKIDDPGPVFFQQRRIGKNGDPFRMHKFRSMVVDAEARLAELELQSEGNGVLFKLKNDPRITKLGAFMRRYSIDELPQLWNVVVGEMSLVGPRPPLPSEVETYEEHVHRRLMVTPGITGLWQVSGRSDLSWDDSVRLDLYYVENWSLTQDLIIMLKTAKAVFGKSGAY